MLFLRQPAWLWLKKNDPAEFKEKVSSSAEPIEKKPVDKRNTLNDLNGTEWLPATKSYMYQKGLDRKL